MRGSLSLGKILGIDIRLHYSWFLLFVFVTVSFLTDFQSVGHSAPISLLAGVAASLLIFTSVVAHELAHSLVAVRSGIPVRSITLFILGGVANMAKEADRPRTEALMAIAGPACSLAIGLVSGAAWFAVGGYSGETSVFHDVLFWMASLNIMLGVFNLLPGFPMDGGRVVRAMLWKRTRDYRRATRIASICGQIIGWLMAVAGVAIAVSYVIGSKITLGLVFEAVSRGGWFVLMGWFLSSIAVSSYRQVAWREDLQGITAASAMTTDFVTVSPDVTLMQLVRNYIQPNKCRGVVVATEGRFLGVVDAESIRRVNQERWESTPAGLVMTPLAKVVTVSPEEKGVEIAAKMNESHLDGIPVVSDGTVLGIVTRSGLTRAMRMRAQPTV